MALWNICYSQLLLKAGLAEQRKKRRFVSNWWHATSPPLQPYYDLESFILIMVNFLQDNNIKALLATATPLAWINMPLFDYRQCLKSGIVSCLNNTTVSNWI